MNLHSFAIIALLAFVSVSTHGQLFTPLGLGIEKCKRQGVFSQPQMNVEGDILYVCTCQGLYSKDLSNGESTLQLVGFEGIPLQDYVRMGDDILALRYNMNGDFLLLSHDGGKTYEDVTPELFRKHTDWTNYLVSLVQHPTDPNTLLILSAPMGVFQSSDFGKTWNQLTDVMFGNAGASFIGFHPLNPNIIYNSGESMFMFPQINISYDCGQTWDYFSPPFPGDNCVHRIAFHPSDPNRWIAGGEGVVFTSSDNGHTWRTQNYWGDDQRSAYWFFTAYDDKNSDVVYMAGFTTGEKGVIKIMCSVDCGKSWDIVCTEPKKESLEIEAVNDLQQYGDKLLVYTESDVYELSKAELIMQIPFVRRIESSEIYDLQGRPADSPQKGILVKSGKKVLIK